MADITNDRPLVLLAGWRVFARSADANVWRWKWNLFERFARESRHNGLTWNVLFHFGWKWNEIYENIFRTENGNFFTWWGCVRGLSHMKICERHFTSRKNLLNSNQCLVTPPPHRPYRKEHRKTFSSDLCGLDREDRELRTEMKFSAECFHFFLSPESRMKVVKVSRSFNLCTFCLKSPFHIILSRAFCFPRSRGYLSTRKREFIFYSDHFV